MKNILISLIFLVNLAHSQGKSLYGISLSSINGGTIDMAAYEGKKVIVAVLSLSRSNMEEWHALDSLSKNQKKNLAVIAILARDTGLASQVNLLNRKALLDTLHISFPIVMESRVTKSAMNAQQPLVKWLTHKSGNKHFNRDIKEDGQFFVISEMGDLFAVMKKKSLRNKTLMQKILNKNVVHIQ